jgi:hypothetical protein
VVSRSSPPLIISNQLQFLEEYLWKCSESHYKVCKLDFVNPHHEIHELRIKEQQKHIDLAKI